MQTIHILAINARGANLNIPKRKLIIKLIVISVVAVNALVVLLRVLSTDNTPRDLSRAGQANPHQRHRIDQVIAKLDSEFLEQSIEKLTEDELYFHPGFHSPQKMAQINLELMLSNRRCIKVFTKLKQFSSDQRDTKCQEIFQLVFKKHTDAIRTVLAHTENPSLPSNSQSMYASQLATCAAIFATAQFALPKTFFGQLQQLDDFSNEIDDRMRLSEIDYPPGLVLTIKNYCVPDNRFRLNVLYILAKRLASSEVLKQIESECSILGKSKLPIVPWNAQIAWFDIPRRSEGIPIDTSKGVETYIFFSDWANSALFLNMNGQNQLISKVSRLLSAELI